MSIPRIVVVRLASASQQRGWMDRRTTVLGTAPAPFADGAVVWQLSSANNRPLARSVHTYATVDEAVEHVSVARSAGLRMSQRPVRTRSGSAYVWFATVAGECVLMSARSYSSLRDARDSFTAAAQAMSTAAVLAEGLIGGERTR